MTKRGLIGCGIVGLLGLGGCVGLGVVFVGGVFALTQPVVDASEQFLSSIGRGKTAEAYAAAAEGLRARLDEASFAAAVRQLGLTDYAAASWHSRTIENQEGTAEGSVTTKAGGTRPISVRLVREGGRWAVLGVRYGGVDLVTATARPPAPPGAGPGPSGGAERAAAKAPPAVTSGAELERMAEEALLNFNQAVRAKDFTAFYGTLADAWKAETSPQQLRQAFREFIDKGVDIGAIKDVKPRLAHPAAVNGRGLLVIAGHYPTRPSRVGFELKYAREAGVWKLAGITVEVGNGGGSDE
jgi:hypothetical protein